MIADKQNPGGCIAQTGSFGRLARVVDATAQEPERHRDRLHWRCDRGDFRSELRSECNQRACLGNHPGAEGRRRGSFSTEEFDSAGCETSERV